MAQRISHQAVLATNLPKPLSDFLAHSPEDRIFSYQVNGTQSNLKVNISTFTPGSCLDGFEQQKNESGLIPNSAFLKLKHTYDCSISTSKQN